MKFELRLGTALGVFLLMASPGGAADLPKTGSFHMKSTATGSSDLVPIGKGESYLNIWKEIGKVEGDSPLGNMTTRCYGTAETFKLTNETPQGHCVFRDADGDQIVYRTADEKHDEGRAVFRGWGQAVLGTGKYEGIVANYVVTCELDGPSSGYDLACEGQGSYILR
jgi:hypothetical protein